jgi:hypothetical protein
MCFSHKEEKEFVQMTEGLAASMYRGGWCTIRIHNQFLHLRNEQRVPLGTPRRIVPLCNLNAVENSCSSSSSTGAASYSASPS